MGILSRLENTLEHELNRGLKEKESNEINMRSGSKISIKSKWSLWVWRY